MKKTFALLCALLLLAVSCAAAEGDPIVEFPGRFRLNGTLPGGYRFSLQSQTELTLEGEIVSDAPAAPVLAVYLAFNESYAGVTTLSDLGNEGLELIRQGFLEENDVTFETADTASGDRLLVVREAGGQFLDFYTVRGGFEIELTLLPAAGQSLTEEQAGTFLNFMRALSIQPLAD